MVPALKVPPAPVVPYSVPPISSRLDWKGSEPSVPSKAKSVVRVWAWAAENPPTIIRNKVHRRANESGLLGRDCSIESPCNLTLRGSGGRQELAAVGKCITEPADVKTVFRGFRRTLCAWCKQ